MGRTKTTDSDKLAVYLKQKAKPVLTEVLAEAFEVCRKTIVKACREAREVDGYPIYPTSQGQYYMAKIQNAKDMTLILAVQDWTATSGAAMRRLNGAARNVIEKK